MGILDEFTKSELFAYAQILAMDPERKRLFEFVLKIIDEKQKYGELTYNPKVKAPCVVTKNESVNIKVIEERKQQQGKIEEKKQKQSQSGFWKSLMSNMRQLCQNMRWQSRSTEPRELEKSKSKQKEKASPFSADFQEAQQLLAPSADKGMGTKGEQKEKLES